MKSFNIVDALHSLRSNASWSMEDFDYSKLVWSDQNTEAPPTERELAQEILRLQAEYNAKAYQRNRAAEYPPIPDQLDLLYHGGYDAWKAAIQAVKDKYPKGAA